LVADLLILSRASYAVSGLAVAAAITALAVLLIGTAVRIQGKGVPVATLFSIITANAAGWLTAFALMYASPEPAVALMWARIGLAFATLLSASLFHFASSYDPRRSRLRIPVRVCWGVAAVLAVLVLTTPLFVTLVTHYSWGYYFVLDGRASILIAIHALMTAPAILFLGRAYQTATEVARERAAALVLACVLGCLGFFDILPAIGVPMIPVGYTAVLAFVVVSAAALWRYELIDLTLEYASAQILQTMKNAVLVIDMAGFIRVANHAACSMLGLAMADLVGHHMRRILHHDENTSTKRLLNSTGVLELSMKWVTASGADIDVLTTSSFVRDISGVPIGVVYVASDYTERRRNEEALRESELRYRSLFDANPLPMWVYDMETLQFISVNNAAVENYGYKRDEFMAMRATDIDVKDDAVQASLITSVRHARKDGSVIDVEPSSFEFMSGSRKARLVIAQDVTDRRGAEERLRESEARHRLLFERNLAGVYRTTTDGRILDCNDSFARIFGYPSRDHLTRLSARALYFHDEDRDLLIGRLREHGSLSNIEARMRRGDDTAVWVIENMTLLPGRNGEPDVIEGTIIDITDRKYAQEQMEFQAYHDVLTGLPNRLLFRDRVTVALAHARRNGHAAAVLFVDLDEFKAVNDQLGHTVGDRLLQIVAHRLTNAVRQEDTVARMGGDEFTILLSEVGPDGRGVSAVARKILDSVSEPAVVDEHELQVRVSAGISLYPGDGFDAEALLRNADRAMYRAKQLGRNNYQFATPPPFDDRRMLQDRLEQALERGEFVIHYQPIAAVATGRITAVEALLRWKDPVTGLIAPEDFIPAAEEWDVILPLGEWTIHTACAQLRRWHDAGFGSLRLCVNLSGRQFQHRNLPLILSDALEGNGLRAQSLEVEITESTAMQNAELSLLTMRELKEMGVHIAIDDFGTGYSSLSYLKRFPIDTVKIDQEFIRDLTSDSNDRAIISAIIVMARALDLRVVAEGVETDDQLAFLKREACEEMQGFLYSEPLAPAELELLLRRAAAPKSRLQAPH
jgi:diguanylate cyclase (GGDEF)-like protein/PAS domain S-box-containing protein